MRPGSGKVKTNGCIYDEGRNPLYETDRLLLHSFPPSASPLAAAPSPFPCAG